MIDDIRKRVLSGFTDWGSLGNIYAREHNGLLLFNYTHAAMGSSWNAYERTCRGLMINAQTGEVAALPFEKFFNWNEGGRNTKAHPVEATEKLDGSLGVLYYNDGFKISTRGSFDGKQALWATGYLNTMYPELEDTFPRDVTLLFEIIYPENRIVIDYEAREDLVLIGARNTRTYEDYLWFPSMTEWVHQYGFSTPLFFNFNSWKVAMDARDKLGYESEGFVLRFSDGKRFKFKGDAYTRAHGVMASVTLKKVIHAIETGDLYDLVRGIPEEFLGIINDHEAHIEQTVAYVTARVESEYSESPGSSRKAFAIWARQYYKEDMPYLFARLDNKPLRQIILRAKFGYSPKL